MASGFPDWLKASALLGQHAGDYIVVAVTDTGQLYALLQGETAEGDIETVRLDDEGRMSAFVIDSQDAWDRMLTIGNAELAARLGSSVIYDKRGQVLFVESFEGGWYRWKLNKDGLLAAGEITPEAAATGGYCVKLTGGSTLTHFAGIERRVASRPVGRMGLEFSFSVPGSWDYILASLYLFTGALAYIAAVKFVSATGNLRVLDQVWGYPIVGTGTALGGYLKWFNTIKIVGDISTGKYTRLMFNNQEIAIPTNTLKVDDDVTTPPGIMVDIAFYSRLANNDVMYLDDIILTGAEPE